MKKILFIGAILLLFAGFAIAQEESEKTQEFKIYAGWNLIPNGVTVGDGSNLYGNIKYVWTYSPLHGKYYGTAFNAKGQPTQVNGAFPYESYANYYGYLTPGQIGTSTWAYFEKPTSITLSTSRSMSLTLKIFKGWNFLYITKQMIDSRLNSPDILRNCYVEKAYSWDADIQSWGSNAANNGAVYFELKQEYFGKNIVIKVAADCQLSETAAVPDAPTLPE